jgi:hypothetical protein
MNNIKCLSVLCLYILWRHTWFENKLRELNVIKVLHTLLLNITVVAVKVITSGSYALVPVSSPPFKTILELVLWNSLTESSVRAGALSWNKTTKHTQIIIDVTQKETVICQHKQHSCETLICQRHQTILRFLTTAAMASTQWRVRELFSQTW